MAEFGLTDDGFLPKRLTDIEAEVVSDETDVFGEIDTSSDSVLGQINGVLSKILADIWEIMDTVYKSQYPATSEGFSLDNVAQLIGVERLSATSTTVRALAIGQQGTVITIGSQASVSTTLDVYESLIATTIDAADALTGDVNITTVVDDIDYTCTIDTVPFTIDSGPGATNLTIVAALIIAINTGQTAVSATDNLDGTYSLLAVDNTTAYDFSVNGNQAITSIGTPVPFAAIVPGALILPATSLNTIDTQIFGWDAVSNLLQGLTGRALEDDVDLRLRMRQSTGILGAGTVESIRSRIQQGVEGVTQVNVFENRTDVTVDGRTPHSFEAVVQGGADQDIGDLIFIVKPAGIETIKADPPDGVSVVVIDSNGDPQTINFSRPKDQFAHVRVTLTLNPEEVYPDDGDASVQASILKFGNTLNIGDDILIQHFFGPIFETPGIKSAVVETAITPNPGDTPTFGTVDISIAQNELAVFADTRIEVISP